MSPEEDGHASARGSHPSFAARSSNRLLPDGRYELERTVDLSALLKENLG